MSQRRSPARLPASLFLAFLAVGPALVAQSTGTFLVGASAATENDEDFARSVKQWTTRPEFISPLVDHLPKVAGIPSPKDGIGSHIGTPQKLTYTSNIHRYYRL